MTKTPIKYSDALADEIIDTVRTTTKGIRVLCAENPHWPEMQSIYRWMDKHKEFGERYALAKARQVELLAEEALDVAYNGSGDTYTDSHGNVRCDNEWVQRSRLKVDTIKWIASKLAPKIYGERVHKEIEAKGNLLEKIIDKL